MTDIQIYNKISKLPSSLKVEVNDFIDFLIDKKVSKKNIKRNISKFGCAKGQFSMSTDFDEPLEDFKEYME